MIDGLTKNKNNIKIKMYLNKNLKNWSDNN